MIDVLLHSGLLNATFWAALLALALLIVRRRGLFSSALLIAVLGGGAVLAGGFALYKGYVLPLDIMQDIVSAREFLVGRSLYPADMSERIHDCLDREPEPVSLSLWWSALHQKEVEAWHEARKLHWVQAHPPFMTLFFTPSVLFLNVAGTYAALSLLSLGALFLSLELLQGGLDLNLSRRQSLALSLAVLGWAPVANVLRTGQTGLLLCGLIVGGWYGLRRGRPVLAGVAIGLATCLKLFPGLLLGYLLLRHRRAFASAVLTTVLLLTFTGATAGWDVYREYLVTGHGVVEDYGNRNNNLSLLGFVARASGNLVDAQAIFLAGVVIVLAVVAWLVSHPVAVAGQKRQQMDLEYSLFVALMPLLSPITWDHYLVVLLLPLAVLGRDVLEANRHGARAAWLMIVVILAIPDTTFFWLSPIIQEQFGTVANSVVVQSLRTVVMAACCLWLARLIHVGQNCTASPGSGRTTSCLHQQDRERNRGDAARVRIIMGATATADTWVTYWDELPEGQLLFRPEADEYVRNLLAVFPLTQGTRLLDFGCGYGFVAEALASRVGECLIWDAAPSMCQHTLARLAHHANVRLLDGKNPEPASLDLILVNSVVQYMTPPELAGWLERWRLMLAPTGQVVLSDLIPPGHRFVKDLLSLLRFSICRGYLFRAIRNVLATRKRYQQAEHARPLYHPAREELTRMARAAGLETRFLPRNLTHFRGRLTAVLTPAEGASR